MMICILFAHPVAEKNTYRMYTEKYIRIKRYTFY